MAFRKRSVSTCSSFSSASSQSPRGQSVAPGEPPFPAFHAMKNTHWCLLLAPLLALGSVAAAADLPSSPYSMPAVGPAYPPPPWRYRDCRLLVLTLRSDPEVVKRLVPPPLPHS